MNISEVMQLPQITIPCGNMNFMKVQRIHLKYEMNYNCSNMGVESRIMLSKPARAGKLLHFSTETYRYNNSNFY